MLGEILNLKVIRITDYSYILEGDIFMHFNDTSKEYKEDDDVWVFIYLDSHKRVCATDKEAYLDIFSAEFLKVVDYKENVGFFLDMGIKKNLLLTTDNLPFNELKWPKIGDEIFVKLKVSKAGLFAKLVNKEEFEEYIRVSEELEDGKKYNAIVMKSGDEGVNLITKTGNLIFIYKKNTRRILRIGESVNVKIIKKTSIGYNGTLIENKENMFIGDAKTIYLYLVKNGNKTRMTLKTDPKEIFEKLHMSKRAFKNGIGYLYKNRIIDIDEKSIFVIKNMEIKN